ncbi:MAG: helix-turn-helix domain-containing protein [Bacteroidota bacterium]|jgi:transcriptional regulator with XRE-family HTH domain
MKTGQLIKELRLKKGLTQEDLAAKTYISARTIQRIENDEVDPRAYSLKIIAAALEVDFEVLANCDKGVSEDAKPDYNNLWLALLHLSGLFILLIPPVIIWFWKKDKIKNMREQGIDVINFQLSMLIFLVPSGILAVFLITIPIIIFIGLFSTVVIIVNTIKVINNQPYKYPMTIKILKP